MELKTTASRELLTQPIEYFRSLPVKTIQDAIESDSKLIVALKKELPTLVFESVLVRILGNVIEFFNITNTMNEIQLAETVTLVADKFYFLKLADLKIWSNGIKSGNYLQFNNNKMFNRIDGQIIILSLSEYCEERIATSERININKHKEVMDKNENYIIKVGNNFVRSVEEDFEPVEKRELATAYTFSVARLIKKSLSNLSDEKIEIIDISRGLTAANTFFDYLAEHKPELLPQGEKFRRATSDYHIQKQAIMKDDSLNELEKVNKVRALAGIEPLTMEQFLEQQKLK